MPACCGLASDTLRSSLKLPSVVTRSGEFAKLCAGEQVDVGVFGLHRRARRILAAISNCFGSAPAQEPRKNPDLPGLQIFGSAAAAACRGPSSGRADRHSPGAPSAGEDRACGRSRWSGCARPNHPAPRARRRTRRRAAPPSRPWSSRPLPYAPGVLGVSVCSFQNFTGSAAVRLTTLPSGTETVLPILAVERSADSAHWATSSPARDSCWRSACVAPVAASTKYASEKCSS